MSNATATVQNLANEIAKNGSFKSWQDLRDALKRDPSFTSEFNGDSNALRSICRAALASLKPAKAEKPAKAKKAGKAEKTEKTESEEKSTRGMTVTPAEGNEKFKGLDRLLFQLDKGGPATAGALSRGLDLSSTFVNKTVGRPDSRGQQLKYVELDGKTGFLSITEAGRTYYTSPKPTKEKKSAKLTELAAPKKTVKGAKRPKADK